LAQVCEALAEKKINIYALTISDTIDHAVVRLVVSDPLTAIHLFGERGVLVVENDVLVLENSNKPGSLGRISEALAKARINIEYAYLATSPGAKQGLLVLRVKNPEKALKALKEFKAAK
jgi:hypothetical protein